MHVIFSLTSEKLIIENKTKAGIKSQQSENFHVFALLIREKIKNFFHDG